MTNKVHTFWECHNFFQNLPVALNFIIVNVIQLEDFFNLLWPSQNIWTLCTLFTRFRKYESEFTPILHLPQLEYIYGLNADWTRVKNCSAQSKNGIDMASMKNSLPDIFDINIYGNLVLQFKVSYTKVWSFLKHFFA